MRWHRYLQKKKAARAAFFFGRRQGQAATMRPRPAAPASTLSDLSVLAV